MGFFFFGEGVLSDMYKKGLQQMKGTQAEHHAGAECSGLLVPEALIW
jgi:hypothetical protein